MVGGDWPTGKTFFIFSLADKRPPLETEGTCVWLPRVLLGSCKMAQLQLLDTIEATRSFCEQTIGTLALPVPSQSATNPAQSQNELPDAQSLLTPAASLLRAQTTKLSLLSSSTPFTPSAISTVLVTIKDSVLPALLTAALLTHDPATAKFTKDFQNEAKALIKDVIGSFTQLLNVLKQITPAAQQNPDAAIPDDQKNELMQATGKTWEACDAVVELGSGGVVGLVIRKARTHLELLKDGIRELEEWDPENDNDDDDFVFDDGTENADDNKPAPAAKEDDDEEEQNRLKLLTTEKEKLVRFLTVVSKVYPAVITQCLKPLLSSSTSSEPAATAAQATNPINAEEMESLSSTLSELPGLVDDVVGSLYDDELESVAEQKSVIMKRAQQALDMALSFLSLEEKKDTREKLVKWNDGWTKILKSTQ